MSPEQQNQIAMKETLMTSQETKSALDIENSVFTLLEASQTGNPNLVHRLLEEGANPNIRNEKLQTPLHLASEGNHQRVAQHLISYGAEINVIDENQETPLFLASRNGHWKIVTLLLSNAADPEIKTLNQHTPLYIAAKNGNWHALLHLLKFGANVNSPDDNQETPLHIACKDGNYKVVQELLTYGADVHYMDKDQNTPLHSTLLEMENKSFDASILEELLRRGSIVNKKNGNLKTPLSIAAEKGLYSATRKLLEAGADVSLTDSENNLPMHMACQNRHVEIVQELLKKSNDIDRCNAKQLTSRMLAKDVMGFAQVFEAAEIVHGKNINSLHFCFNCFEL